MHLPPENNEKKNLRLYMIRVALARSLTPWLQENKNTTSVRVIKKLFSCSVIMQKEDGSCELDEGGGDTSYCYYVTALINFRFHNLI